MNLMLPTARRKDGEKQPCIKIWKFDLRIPFIHYEWEIPEMIQACVVFMTGSAATAYLQDLFGFTFEMALSIVFVHELLYMVNNTLGDPLIGGWITPAVPLITAFLLNFEGTDRMYALVGMELILGLMYVILGVTGIATKIIDICPQSLKAGILIGSGFAACCGTYGFKSVADGGAGFFQYPISWSIGCALGLFLLFSNGFGKVKFGSKSRAIKLLTKAGFVPAIIVAGIIAMIIGECDLPDFSTVTSFWFNPFPGLMWVWNNFSILGIGIPPAYGHHVLRHRLRRHRRRHCLYGGHQALSSGRVHRRQPRPYQHVLRLPELDRGLLQPHLHHVWSPVVCHDRVCGRAL